MFFAVFAIIRDNAERSNSESAHTAIVWSQPLVSCQNSLPVFDRSCHVGNLRGTSRVKKAKIVLTFCTSIIKLGNLFQIGQMKDLQPAQRFSRFDGSARYLGGQAPQ